ncbi:MAG: hypothetical protein K6E16_10115 [Lachnospiraceae bacterium]|nr:hypothetical protein [Lachnospiraceae bacterium]
MSNKNHERAKILILITAVVFVVTTIILGALAINYFSTGSDPAAVALIFASSMSAIFTTLPCLAMAITGTVFAAKSKNEGVAQSKKYFIIGIVETAVYGLGVLCGIVAFFFTILALSR